MNHTKGVLLLFFKASVTGTYLCSLCSYFVFVAPLVTSFPFSSRHSAFQRWTINAQGEIWV